MARLACFDRRCEKGIAVDGKVKELIRVYGELPDLVPTAACTWFSIRDDDDFMYIDITAWGQC